MPLQKICNKCQQAKAIALFYANKRMKDGLNTFCTECHKADNIARKAIKRANPLFKQTELAYKKEYRARTEVARAMYMSQWRKLRKEHVLAYSKTYRDAHKSRYNFLCQKRKIDLANRVPHWLTADDLWIIKEAYELANLRTKLFGFSWHVDHVIPLRGKRVSGLHVPQNIRVIPALENMQKTNKYEV